MGKHQSLETASAQPPPTWRSRFALTSAAIISAVVLILYFPALHAGFVYDDWWNLRQFLITPPPDNLLNSFDPRGQFIWYHPIAGIVWAFEFLLFGVNPIGYHLTHVLIHLGNSLLLLSLITRITHSLRAGIVSASIFATVPLANESVVWPSDSQVPATFFSLLSIHLWWSYLHSERRTHYLFAIALAFLALLTKATTFTLPIILVLIDRLLVRKPISFGTLIRRYLPFALPAPLYLIALFPSIMRGFSSAETGYGLGPQNLANLLQYFSLLSLPWDTTIPALVWLPIIALVLWTIAHRPSRSIVFFTLAILIVLLPWLFLEYVQRRYMYAPAILVSVILGFSTERICRAARSHLIKAACAGFISYLLIAGGTSAAQCFEYWTSLSHHERLPFRQIAQRYPTLPQGTLLYFINAWDEAWETLALIRYGKHVSVSFIVVPARANLRDYQNPLVFYISPQGDTHELAMDANITTHITPGLPIQFEQSMRLEGYELTRQQVKRGETIGLILYWKTETRLERDYTVFVHFIDDQAQTIAGFDGMPREGKAPTSQWRVNELMPDGRILEIPANAPVGAPLRLEIGLYYLPTMERLAILGLNGEPIGTSLIIEHLIVLE